MSTAPVEDALAATRRRLDELVRLAELARHLPGEGSDRRREGLLEDAAALRFWFARRADPGLPNLVVLFGGSGVGKSTLFNALVGGEPAFVSSVERPATRGALVGGAAEAIDRLLEQDLFPTFECGAAPEREERTRGAEGRLSFVARPDSAGGLVVDCPDFDTHIDANRHIAERLLSWADRVVFVTSVERYADRSAAPYLERIRRAGFDALFVLTKVGEGEAELPAAFARQLGADEGGAAPRVIAIERARASAGVRTGLTALRAELARPIDAAGGERRLADLLRRFDRDLRAPLAERARRDVALVRSLAEAGRGESGLEVPPDLENLRRFELDTKPLLKLGPRPALRLLRTLVARPSREERREPADEAPPGTDRAAIASALRDQAWRVLERVQIETRDRLDRSDHAALLGSDDLAAAELDAEALDAHLAPVVEELSEFAERARRRHLERRPGTGLADRMRRIVLDRVLRLLGLLLTLLVVPAVVHEALARFGMKDFVNEIEEVLARSRRRFREILDTLVEEQRRRYADLIRTRGPAAEDLAALDRVLDGSGGSGA
ncbi:MAG: hypothetical protein R3F20_04170 [Planctomycetota bacterium]